MNEAYNFNYQPILPFDLSFTLCFLFFFRLFINYEYTVNDLPISIKIVHPIWPLMCLTMTWLLLLA